jgi:hypothetical protein
MSKEIPLLYRGIEIGLKKSKRLKPASSIQVSDPKWKKGADGSSGATSSPLADLPAGSEHPARLLKEDPTKGCDSTPVAPPPVVGPSGPKDANRETVASAARLGAKKAPPSPMKKGR